MNVKMFVMTHKTYNAPTDPIYRTLHVGKKGKADLGYPGDDTGDSISEKNVNYCELTGLYWLWKNYSCDIIGTCHYRRFFLQNGHLLNQEYIEQTLKEYDIIIPRSGATECDTVYDHYKKNHDICDLEICGQIIKEKYSDYYDAYLWCMQGNLLSIGNMMITSKKIFDEYCEWLFGILFEAEKLIMLENKDDYQKRVMGFLSERLFRVWLLKHSYKIKEEAVEMLDIADLNNGIKAMGVVYNLATVLTRTLVQKYNSGKQSMLPEIENDVASDPKMPVWVCWWQGIDNAPELVKNCIDSMYRNFPQDKVAIRVITFENYKKYVFFNDRIVERFNSGALSLTHLSDLLRAQLLYRYGGLWIDATYFVADERLNYIFDDYEFFTQKTNETRWDVDIVKGRWAENLLKGPKGFPLFGFMMEAFEYYWEVKDTLIEYYLMDYIIAVAYDNIPVVHHAIEQCPVNNPKALDLSALSNKPYKKEILEELLKDTCIFKMYHKLQYHKVNIVGEKTIYGKLLEIKS